MARGVNRVILIGTLGRDPEVKYGANGNAVANLNVATSEQWKDKTSGQKQEKTEWHRVVIFGKLAEIAAQYLTKGSQVYLEGKLQTRKWQDKETGNDRYSTEVVIDFNGQMQMLGGGNGQGAEQPSKQNGMAAPQQAFGQQPAPQQAFGQQPAPQQAFGQRPAPQQANGQQRRAPLQQAPAYNANDFDSAEVPF